MSVQQIIFIHPHLQQGGMRVLILPYVPPRVYWVRSAILSEGLLSVHCNGTMVMLTCTV